ncbi:hypothetical protein [Viridibacillus arvi]|uniref:hypothetical protein n=1 Tax=Viridibacillus arvi TaxID=263475 RepID=UPI0034CFD8BA
MNTNNEFLNKVINLKEDIENHVYSKKIPLNTSFIEAISNDKNTLKLLKEITYTVSASVGLDVHEKLGKHYDTSYTTWNRMKYWEEQSKKDVQKMILEKIEEVKATAKVDEFFFYEDEKPTKELREKALSLHKIIAECAINYTFDNDHSEKPDLQARAFEALLQLCELESAIPGNDNVSMRNLISISRFIAITKKESDPTPSINALKAVARNWYQNSDRDFLEHKSGYHQYTYVKYYLYIITSEQLEQVRNEFLEEVESRYDELKAAKWDHDAINWANFLLEKTECILSWEVEE